MPAKGWGQALVLAGVIVVSMTIGGVLAVNVGNDDRSGGEPVASTLPTATRTASPGETVLPVLDAAGAAPTAAAGSVELATVGSLPDVVERVLPSVVVIRSTDIRRSGVFESREEGEGSGIVVDREGHILTNYHVVESADELVVEFWDGTAAVASVVGFDEANDLAVIRVSIPPERLHPAQFGDSDAVRVGEAVFAVGNPLSLEFSVSRGIVSGPPRGDAIGTALGSYIRGVIQTDATLQPGNSGGPLLNLAGEVIGINTAIRADGTRTFMGIGFAVPSNTALRFLSDMIAGREIQHPQLGISGETVNEINADGFGLEVTRGVYVLSVLSGSGADRAGLRPDAANGFGAPRGGGDVITAIGGVNVTTMGELARIIDRHDVGDEITLSVVRGSRQLELVATLEAWQLG